MHLIKKIVTLRQKLRSTTLNAHSTSLNIGSASLNAGSTTLNEDFILGYSYFSAGLSVSVGQYGFW